ncbi:acid-sensing ion channel 5-like isoform X2 [Ruditapes philippinarum]|uniref:acid-sensing ion channel 5-like isoform X2 n=1 Tax=Ruditapes philippinarum TaxID=129788 RepID=UPI00295C0163|nr:acid-sensing ion channel 5-like isoform X2 [Ruditapes philippinarum]
MADFESQSWKDRCDRYFTSISDTGKDRDQEKTAKNDSENSREKRASLDDFFDDGEKGWKDLSEIKKAFSEHWFLRHIRNALSVLDIHGSNIASKAKNTVGFTIWAILTLVSVITFGILLYFMLQEYLNRPSSFRVTSLSTSERVVSSDISLTVCNLNVIKKSRLPDTGLNELHKFVSGETKAAPRTEKVTVKEMIESNEKLTEFVTEHNPGKVSELVKSIENDVIVQELIHSSEESLLFRLSKYARPQILREVTHITKDDVERAGHVTNETLVQCWRDNSECQLRDIHTDSDSEEGNCVVVGGLRNSTQVDIVLNAQTDEYIHQITPSVGFKVYLSDSDGTHLFSSSVIEISPGFRSTISLNKVTTVTRLERSCSSSSGSKAECELNCLESHVVNICECSTNRQTSNTKLCMMNFVSDYICVQSIKQLQTQGHLPCQCREQCREKKFDLKMSTVGWPHKQYMELFGSRLLPGHQNLNESYLRENIAFLTINLQPALTEDIEEIEPFEIMDMLARIGGLSAIIAGISVITVIEILYIALQSLIRFMRYIRKRSGSVASQKRLSDSEITSITWAVYRQRRRFEEVNKMKADNLANNVGVNAIGGNVHARISKRSSYDREPNNEHVVTNNHKQYRPNEYSRRYDGKNPFYQPRTRDSLVKDPDFPKENNGESYAVNVIRPHRPTDYIYDSRPDPVHTGHALYKNGTKYKETNAGDRHQPQNVFLYDGAVAYFNPANVSEPVYL